MAPARQSSLGAVGCGSVMLVLWFVLILESKVEKKRIEITQNLKNIILEVVVRVTRFRHKMITQSNNENINCSFR